MAAPKSCDAAAAQASMAANALVIGFGNWGVPSGPTWVSIEPSVGKLPGAAVIKVKR